jgi:hypothetical protein
MSLAGALLAIALPFSIYAEKATAQQASIGVCGLTIPKEYKDFV